MAKNKLNVTYDFDFILLAINANVRPYKLAWAVNNNLKLSLVRLENISIEFTKGKHLSIINYFTESEYQKIRLLCNKCENTEERFSPYLLPELKNFDYLIVLENESNTFDENAFINKTKQIPFVQFATKVDLQNLKSRDNLIF